MKYLPKNIQTLMFSATITPQLLETQNIKPFIRKEGDPVYVNTTTDLIQTVEQLVQVHF